MTFANPGYLVLLILLVPAVIFYIWKQKRAHATLQIPSVSPFAGVPKSWKEYLRHVNFALLLSAFALVIIVMARPQSSDSWSQSSTEGIDIVLAMDVSYSMNT